MSLSLGFLAGVPVGMLAVGALVFLFLGYALFRERSESGSGARAIRSSGKRLGSGISTGSRLAKATGFAGFVVLETLIAEVAGIGFSLLDIAGPLVASNLFAVGFGTLSLTGIVPVSPWWYAGVSLMILGIAISSAGEAVFERYSEA